MRRTRFFLGVGVVLVLVAGCTGSSSPSSSTSAAAPTTSGTTTSATGSTPAATPSPSTTKPAPPRVVEPLTGLPVRVVPRRPVVVVKIENSGAARPQTGLNAADLVVEELVEGGITRFAAMFHTTLPTNVGPVRSLRDVDRAIAGPTAGLLVASGGAGVVRARVRQGGAQLALPTSDGRYFSRSGSRPIPHNLYVNVQGIQRVANRQHRNPPSRTYLPFAASVAQASAVTSGIPAKRIGLVFSPAATPNWTYDTASKNWLRSEGSSPSTLTSGARISARTVLVIRVTTRDAGYSDPAGNYVPRTVFVGRGDGTVFCQGRRINVTWIKPSPTAPLQLVNRYSGKPMLIAPGRTWIEMLPTSGSLRIG